MPTPRIGRAGERPAKGPAKGETCTRGPQRSPEHLASMRAAKAAKRTGLSTAAAKPTIVEFMTRDLSLTPSEHQTTLLKAFYGMELTPRELKIWAECTGRREYPGRPFVELTLVSGARSGKNSYVLTPILLFEAIHGGFRVNPGETVVVPLVAQDATACDVSMRLVKEYARRLRGAVVDETSRRLTLANGVEFRLFPCTSKSLYGVSICAAGLDEVGRFKFAGADTDEDIEAGALRGMGQFGNRAKLVVTSTPAGKAGLLWRNFERSWGRPDPVRLVWRSTSAQMAPSVNAPEFLERMRATMDPVRYARLFDAEFSEDASVFLAVAAVDRSTDWGVAERMPRDFAPGTRFVAFCDPAGHGPDEFTLAVVAIVGEGSARKFVQAVMWVAPKGRPGAVKDTDAWVGLASNVLRRFGLSRVFGDRATGGWVLDAFRRRGVMYEYPHLRRDERDVAREMRDRQAYANRSMLYLEAGVALRSGAVRLLDDAQLRRELTNLEQSGDRVEPGPMHDDRANAAMGAVAMALQLGLGVPRPIGGPLDKVLAIASRARFEPRAEPAKPGEPRSKCCGAKIDYSFFATGICMGCSGQAPTVAGEGPGDPPPPREAIGVDVDGPRRSARGSVATTWGGPVGGQAMWLMRRNARPPWAH